MVTLVKKVAGALVTLLLATVLAFLLGRTAGDPVANLLGPLAPKDQVDAMKAELGVDQPLLAQLGSYLGQLATGDLGTSLRYNRPNIDLISEALPASLQLAVAGMAIAIVIGVPLGVLSALRPGTIVDRLSSVLALLGQSIPAFWLGLMLALVFAVQFGWLPAAGTGTVKHLVLPAVTLSMVPLARIARLTRSSLIEVFTQEYIDSARARGVKGTRLLLRHAARNAALPVVTIIGLQVGALVSGVVTIEAVFGWPGMGSMALSAVSFRDFPLVQAVVVVGVAVFVVVNLLTDLLYSYLDPRVSLKAKG